MRSLVLTLPFLALPLNARAQIPDVVDVSAGVKGFAGGGLWTAPSDAPASYSGLGFPGATGGFGFSGGIYGEARFYRFVGLEIDALFDSSNFFRNVTYNGVVKLSERVSANTLRLPVLLKGVLPVGASRVELFVGPELAVPLSVSPTVEVLSGGPVAPDPSTFIHADQPSSVLLTLGLGAAPKIGERLELPIEIRASKNLSQPDAWRDRVTIQGNDLSRGYTVKAQTSWDFRLGVGLGYRF